MTATRRPDDEDTGRYFRAVEEHFVRLRGTPLVLSPGDWHLAASWYERGIPLALVLRAITAVFETAAARQRGRRVHSLAYCRHAVEEAYVLHLAAMVGQAETASSPSLPRRRLGEKVEAWSRRAAEWPTELLAEARAALDRVREIVGALEGGELSPEAAEKLLAGQERVLLDLAQRALDPRILEDLRTSCDRRLADYRQRMEMEVYARTRRRALDGALRRRLEVPRLSLLLN
jgi:hypothetical protein